MRIIDLMNELASSVGIGCVTPDEGGCLTLLFDNTHEVTFMPDGDDDSVYFQCELGDASPLGSDGCKTLLEASFSQTNGAAFSIHPAMQKVVIWKRYGEFASLSVFEKAINDFLGQVVVWKQRMESGNFNAELASTSPAPNLSSLPLNFIQV